MEFTLKYRGDLLRPPTAQKGRVEEKHAIRRCLHEQLKQLWSQDPRLKEIRIDHLPPPMRSADMKFDLARPIGLTLPPLMGFMFRHQIQRQAFIPLVTEPMEAHCHLAIRWHLPHKPRTIIFAGGDLDGRLKTLFDALRMPHTEAEFPQEAATDDACYCLLADDSLITKLSIEAFTLLGSYPNGHYAEVDIDVTIRAVTPMAGTYSLLFA